ncbi:microtubule-actin cross-linking factor 1, isoforms 6/7 isoform X5 [Chiloscyllium punctatum]|uniref:microtubule-actin cross-linking factor 1, isoforms 6/7 isoform X5 n=1 Tax=Chiloscyllium punctatum TaxID=137246 RepID=UPI003B634821
MGSCSSHSLCLGHDRKHCQARLPEPSGIHKTGCQTVSGNDHNGLKLSSDDLEQFTKAWTCRDTGSLTKQSDGESKDISKVELVTEDISNVKADSLHQFWLSVGRDCRCECGTGWSWQTVTGQEVTEIREVTETVITEVIEVTEFPVIQRRSESKKTTMAGILLCHKEPMQEGLESPGECRRETMELGNLQLENNKLQQTEEDPGQTGPSLVSGSLADGLESWISDIEDVTANQRPPSSELEVVKAQLQEQKQLQGSLEELEPVCAELISVSSQLVLLNAADGLYFSKTAIRLQEDYHLLQHQLQEVVISLEKTFRQYLQFLEQVAVLSDSLQKIQDRVWNPPGTPSVSERIQEQIEENRLIFEKLGSLQRALDNVTAQGKELLANNQCPSPDARNRDIPVTLRHRLDCLQEVCEEIETLQNDVKSLRSLGEGLIDSIRSEDTCEVVKHRDELDTLYRNVNKIWRESHDQVKETLHEALQQEEAMKELMSDLYLQKLEVETLAHHSQSFTRQLPVPERELIEGPLQDYRECWEKLERELVSKQHELEKTLLSLGHFQPALQQTLTWLITTQELLDQQRCPSIDLHTCEIQLAKLRVLWNDVRAHESTVQSVHQAGLALLTPNSRKTVSNLSHNLQELDLRWERVKYQTEQQVLELETTVSQAQKLNQEIQGLLLWIDEVEGQLSANGLCEAAQTPQERFQLHLELYKEVESKQCAYDSVYTVMEQFLNDCRDSKGSKTEHRLHTLQHKWNAVHLKMQERKVRLSERVTLETQFHSNAQELIGWIEDAMNMLNKAPAPSLIQEYITIQIQDHQVTCPGRNTVHPPPHHTVAKCYLMAQNHPGRFSSDVASHSAQLNTLEQCSEPLRDYSSKQHRSLIQNVMGTVREKWAKLTQCTSQREQSLQEARKHAQQFSEARKMLQSWMDEVDQHLEAQMDVVIDNNDIKQQLTQQQELMKELRGKRAVYEVTLRIGKTLMDKAEHPGDREGLQELVTDLSEHWNSLNEKSLCRQSMIEEVLLSSGRLTESLQVVLDWLYRAEVTLNEQARVNGDVQSVKTFVEKHKVFQKELGKRASCVRALKRTFRELNKNTGVNCVWLKAQMEELNKQWEHVCNISVLKQSLLEAALCQAEHFQSLVQTLLGHLTQTERKLTGGHILQEQEALLEFKHQHQEAVDSLEHEYPALESVIALGNEILTSCNPESVSIIQSWINMVQTRWDEVRSWASCQGDRVEAAMLSLHLEQQGLQHLQDWLEETAESLSQRDQEVLPENIGQLEELLTQHSVLLDELMRKKTEIERKKKPTSHNLDNHGQVFQQLSSPGEGHCWRSQPHLPRSADSSDAVSPLVAHLLGKWEQLWTRALDRQTRLQEKVQRLYELQALETFSFNTWRKRYMQWISSKKFRMLDIFRYIDKDQDGRISQQEFTQSVLDSKFPTSSVEMEAVAAIFDLNGDGFIDYYEFANALHPSRDHHWRTEDEDRIEDEVCRQVAECNCAPRFQVEQIGANRYRFGDSQQLRMVRILRSTVMVRVGGGWSPLDEFLVKNDPCRVKDRTNLKIKEKYLVPDSYRIGTVKSAGNQTRPHSQEGSPSRKNASVASFNSAPNSPLPRKEREKSLKKE